MDTWTTEQHRPTAVWIKRNDALHTMECSNCGADAHYQLVNRVWRYEPYCAHCGARVYKQEDLPMSENKKPRLAEALGVEVNEKFDFVGGGFTRCCYVDSNGWLRDQNDNMCDTHAVFLINNPQYMRRRPRWTEQEVEDAKAIQRLMSEYTHISRKEISYGTYLSLESEDVESYALSSELFPSLRAGETVELTDIIGGNE